MNALDAILARAQPRYEVGVKIVVDSLRASFGAGRFEGLEVEQVAQALTAVLERRANPTGDGETPVLLRNLQILEWCAGVPVGDDVKARLGRLLRIDYQAPIAGANLKRPRPDLAARRAHVIFAGALDSPLHSPSAATASYLRALADDPKNRRIEVYHAGPIHPDMAARLAEQLPKTGLVKFRQIETHPDYMSEAALRAPCTYHFWCFPPMSIDHSFMAMFGPTVTFTCADEAPLQYADVYWSSQTPEHIERVWAAAPHSFRANFVTTNARHVQVEAPVRVRTKADLGCSDDDVILATVGNRLGVDMDEAFVTGVELALRGRPNCRWLVVGSLPDGLSSAMRQVLGARFIHLEFDRDLPGLMRAADVWINPFRRGGGDSAIIAGAAGLPVLTRADIGDVAACVPPAQRAVGEADYFARLDRLLDDAAMRAAWGQAQRAFFLDAWANQARYVAEIDRMVALAFSRFQGRAKNRLAAVFPEQALAAAAAA